MSKKQILEDLRERFVTGFKDRFDRYYEIFVNPSRKEISEVAKKGDHLRFIADKKSKKLFISHLNVLHQDIQDEVGNMKDHYFDLFSGVAVNNGRLVEVESLNCNIDFEILEGEYDWVEDYGFDLTSIKKELLIDNDIPKKEWKYVLEESWFTGVKIKGKYVEIFKNPSLREIKNIVKESNYKIIRFIAVKDKQDIYMWDAGLATHFNLYRRDYEEYGKENKLDINLIGRDAFSSHGELRGNEIYVDEYDLHDLKKGVREDICGEILDGEYDWMEQYYFDLKHMYESAEDVLKEG